MSFLVPRFIVRDLAACLAAVALLLIGTHVASAAVLNFEANLDGLQVVPPNASPAFGLANLTLDTTTGAVSVVTGSYQDLLGGATAVTLNGMAGPGAPAPVLFALTLDTPGAASGTFSGGGMLGIMANLGMQAGNTYINIRSSVFPSGEIRGQLFEHVPDPVPEPIAIVLASVGALGISACTRRRRIDLITSATTN